jgi:hypothetical protein
MSIAAQLARAQENLAVLQAKLDKAERREARQRADSLDRADNARQFTGREHMMQVQATARAYQSRADEALETWGLRARAPTLGEPLDDYRRDLLIQCKRQLPEDHELRRVQVRQLADDALPVFEQRILAECKASAMRPDSVPPGELRRVETVDGNGLKIVSWIGQRCFTDQFTQPGRRVRIRSPATDPGWFR